MLSLSLRLSSTTWFILGVLLALLVFFLRVRRLNSYLPLPPGPKKRLLIGNLLDMPAERQWEAYAAWSKEFSDCLIFTHSPVLLTHSMKIRTSYT